jgi:hypothetical protein
MAMWPRPGPVGQTACGVVLGWACGQTRSLAARGLAVAIVETALVPVGIR